MRGGLDRWGGEEGRRAGMQLEKEILPTMEFLGSHIAFNGVRKFSLYERRC